MLEDSKFRAPKKWSRVEADEFDGLFLPGGHRAEGMRSYLESWPGDAHTLAKKFDVALRALP